MCLIAFAWQTSKHHRLTLIGNRDEFHRRRPEIRRFHHLHL